jgi:hypothetical protein
VSLLWAVGLEGREQVAVLALLEAGYEPVLLLSNAADD